MFRIFKLYITVHIVNLIGLSSIGICADVPSKTELLQKMEEGYGQLLSLGGQYQEDSTTKSYSVADGVEKLVYSMSGRSRRRPDEEYLLSENQTILAVKHPGKTDAPIATVHALNPQYDFRLEANEPGQWYIAHSAVVGSSSFTEKDRANRDLGITIAAIPTAIHYTNGASFTPYHEFLRLKTIKISSIAKSPTNSQCYRIKYQGLFDRKLPGVDKALRIKTEGWIDVDPEKNYSGVEMDEHAITEFSDTYSHLRNEVSLTDGVALLIKSEATGKATVQGQEANNIRTIYEFKSWLDPDVDPALFTLTAYGLPEPVGITPIEPRRSVPIYVWFLVAAGTLILVTLMTRWWLLRRRRSRAQPVAA